MKSYNLKYKIPYLLISVFISLFLVFNFCQAAILYLEPSVGSYYRGEIFIVETRIDVENECINTVEANLSFSPDILETIDFSQGNSILTLWVKSPTVEQKSGSISFIGGIPGGYCGKLSGEPGENNLLGKIIFKIKEIDEEKQTGVNFVEGSRVLLNDGFGTPAKVTTKGAIFTILTEKIGLPKDEWQKELEKDNVPPELFEIEIHQEPSIFDGKYFISFSTTDKQTGIDYYEIKEGKGDWKKVSSPYLLEDQSLQGKILVKAVDKAGNERIAEYSPLRKPFPYLMLLATIVALVIIGWIIRKLKIKK